MKIQEVVSSKERTVITIQLVLEVNHLDDAS
jgi:hypothetical protein